MTRPHILMIAPGADVTDVGEAWLILCKRKAFLAGLWIASGILAVWVLPQLPKSYTSNATVQLRKSLETVAAEDVGLKPTEAAGQITEDYRDVQMGILTSEQLLRSVASDLVATEPEGSPGLRARLRSLVLDVLSSGSQEAYVDEQVLQRKRIEDLARAVRGGLGVSRGYKSPRVQLSFKHADAGRAQEILEVLIAHYERQVGELYDMGPALERAEELYSEALQEWELISRELQQFRAEHEIADLGMQTATAREDLPECRVPRPRAARRLRARRSPTGLADRRPRTDPRELPHRPGARRQPRLVGALRPAARRPRATRRVALRRGLAGVLGAPGAS
ncbi:MAG: hypothetical protein ACYS26_13665 [Planctomycetota bacterium]|jgi:uncharacterized protein involved in exopolysaccharide biosynthesis